MSSRGIGISHETYPLDGIPLLLRDGDGLSTRWQRGIVVGVLAQKAEELIRVLRDQLGKLRVARTNLLEDGLQHLRLLLHDLAELLELGVVPKEIQIAETLTLTTTGGGGSHSGSSLSTTAAATAATTTTASALALLLLSCQVEQVDALALLTTSRSVATLGNGRGRGGSTCLLLLLLLRLLLQIFRNPLFGISHLSHNPETRRSLR